jgi:hypothetical protein
VAACVWVSRPMAASSEDGCRLHKKEDLPYPEAGAAPVAVRSDSFGVILLGLVVDEIAVECELPDDGVHLPESE